MIDTELLQPYPIMYYSVTLIQPFNLYCNEKTILQIIPVIKLYSHLYQILYATLQCRKFKNKTLNIFNYVL